MLRDLGICVIVVAVSCSLAVATNLLRAQPLTWIREKAPVPSAPAAMPDRPSSPAAAMGGNSTEAQSEVVAHEATAPAGVVQGVVQIDEVLEALATGSAYFVDAREQHEFDEGHLRGAVHLPSSAIYKNIEPVLSMIPTDARVIVYCGGGECEASHNVTDALRRDFGYVDVVIYEKGWQEVIDSGRFGDYLELGGAR